MAKAISVTKLNALVSTGPSIRILDVRRRADFEAAPQSIPSAQWHDPKQLDDWASTLPADQEVVVYCVKGGGVSQSVADRLESQDLRAKFLEGGLKAWKEMGGAVE